MFRKIVTSYMLLTMTAVGTVGVVRSAEAAPVVVSHTANLPAAPAAPVQHNTPAPAPLSTARMGADHGQGWGWLKKLWNKYKKKIIRVIFDIIKEIIENWLNETTQAQEGISGTVTESYSGTDTTEETYASQADYEAGNIQSSSFSDGGYQYDYTDYSGGCYCNDGPFQQEMQL